MSNIRISPDQVDQIAGQFKQSAEQSQQIIARLQASINNLQSQWEGATQQRFYADFETAKRQMESFVQLLTSVGTDLTGIANKFRVTDQSR